MARLLLIDIHETDIEKMVREVECGDLQDYYDNLHCSCFDIANRAVGNSRYDIFVDDEGLFAEKPIVTAIRLGEGGPEPMLVGNLILAKHDGEGNTTSLTDEDISNIEDNIVATINFDEDIPKPRVCLVCDY